ncbi:MAG TPA: hypothetical protein VIH78_10425 [Terriglobales bacterium]|jgi:hypothetical protein
MKTQLMIMERRHRQRGDGVIAEIEDLTYNILRKYGINGPADDLSRNSLPEKAA